MEGTRHRLTVAVEVAEPARAALARALRSLRLEHPGLRWIEPEGWHVALAALGSLTRAQAEKVDTAVAEVTERWPTFALRLDGGAGMVRNQLLYAGIEESGELHTLRREVVERLAVAGFEVDAYDFLPHNPIAQAPTGARLPTGLVSTFQGPAVTWTVRRVVVLRSRLRIGGVVQELRGAHSLMAAGVLGTAGVEAAGGASGTAD